MTQSYTVKITLPNHVLGDKWAGFEIGPIIIDGTTPEDPLTRVRAHFRHSDGTLFKLDSDEADRDQGIEITNAVVWTAVVPEMMVFLPKSGDWIWDMEFYQGDDTAPLTLYCGAIRVSDDITKD